MANPQKEHGFTGIANEILEALARTHIPGRARQCLDLIIRDTWGWKNRKTWPISYERFHLKTGIAMSHIPREIKKLEEMKLIIISFKGSKKGGKKTPWYMINKDYEQWEKTPRRSRIDPLKGKTIQIWEKQSKFGKNTAPEALNSNGSRDPKLSIKVDFKVESKRVWEFWNQQGIIVYDFYPIPNWYGQTLEDALKDILLKHPEIESEEAFYDMVTGSIENYRKIVLSSDYWYSNKNELIEFLNKNFEKFIDWDTAHNNYLRAELRNNISKRFVRTGGDFVEREF